MAISLLLGSVKFQAFDLAGNPLSGGKVYTYTAGTLTPLTTYPTIADAIALTNANQNPTVLDARGEANIAITALTKVILKDSSDATIYTVDNVGSQMSGDIYDTNNNLILKFSATASAVNQVSITNAATGGSPVVSATGTDTNIGLKVKSKGTGVVSVQDSSSNSIATLTPATSAVNYVDITNAATGSGPTLTSSGTDSNINFNIQPKGTGVVKIKGTSTAPATLSLFETTGNGTNSVSLKAASSIGSDITFTLPSADGTSGQALTTDGSATLSFSTVSPYTNAFRVTLSGDQSINSATPTKLTFNTEAFDTKSNFDSATNYRFTPTTAGKYEIILSITYSTAADQAYVIAEIYKNGSAISLPLFRASGTADNACIATVLVSMNGSTDYIEGYAVHYKGSAANAASAYTYMEGFYVCP